MPLTHANGGFRPDVVADRPTGIAATDDAMLATALSDTPEGGWLHLPGHTDRVTAYALINEFAPAKHMRITGSGCFPDWQSVTVGNADAPVASPYLRGAILMQTTAGKSGVKVTTAAKKIDMSGFGVLFHPSIMFSNTGHGFEFSPPADPHGDGTGYDVGLWDAILDNLVVFGHDGSHYGYQEINPLLGQRGPYLRSFGGGVYKMISNSNRFNMGNLAVGEIYGSVFVAGTAHAYHFTTMNTAKLNMVRAFARFQANFDDLSGTFAAATKPTIAQYRLLVDTTAGTAAPDIALDGVDTENNDGVAHPWKVNDTTYIGMAGGYVGDAQSYRPTKGYNRSVAQASRKPTLTAGNAINPTGGGTITFDGSVEADDLAGMISCTVGSTPSASDHRVAFVKFKALAITPRMVILTPGVDGNAVAMGLYVSAYNDGSSNPGFTVRAANIPLTAAQTFEFGYQVVL